MRAEVRVREKLLKRAVGNPLLMAGSSYFRPSLAWAWLQLLGRGGAGACPSSSSPPPAPAALQVTFKQSWLQGRRPDRNLGKRISIRSTVPRDRHVKKKPSSGVLSTLEPRSPASCITIINANSIWTWGCCHNNKPKSRGTGPGDGWAVEGKGIEISGREAGTHIVVAEQLMASFRVVWKIRGYSPREARSLKALGSVPVYLCCAVLCCALYSVLF